MFASSDFIRKNPHSAVKISDSSCLSIDDSFVSLDLVASLPERSILHQHIPSTSCSFCGAYLSSVTRTVPNGDVDSGRKWACVFCQTLNSTDFDIRSTPEIQSRTYDLVQPTSAHPSHSGNRRRTVLSIILCDSMLLLDQEDMFAFFTKALTTLSTVEVENIDQLVSIIFFDKVIRIPRLASMMSTDRPIEIDIFDNKSIAFRQKELLLLQQGYHFTSRKSLQQYLYRFQDVLEIIHRSINVGDLARSKHSRFSFSRNKLFSAGRSSIVEPSVAVDKALSFAKNISDQLATSIIHSNVTILTSETLTSQHEASLLKSKAATSYTMAFNLLQIGSRAMKVPSTITETIKASGGFWVTGEHVTDDNVVQDAQKLFSPQWQARHRNILSSSSIASVGEDQTLSIWSTPNVRVTALGPVIAQHDSRRSAQPAVKQTMQLQAANSDEIVLTLQLQHEDTKLVASNSVSLSSPLSNKSSDPSGSSWVHRAMRYLHTSTQGPIIPTTTTATTTEHNSAIMGREAGSSPGVATNSFTAATAEYELDSEETVCVMVAWTLPSCDYDCLYHWSDFSNEARPTRSAFQLNKVTRVWTIVLPLRQLSSSSVLVPASSQHPYWTLNRSIFPLPLISQSQTATSSSVAQCRREQYQLGISSGDMWALGVAQMLTQFYETETAKSESTSSKEKKESPKYLAHQHCMHIIDHLSVQLMKRLTILHSMSRGDSISRNNQWLQSMIAANYDALWGLYSYRYGPLWAQNHVLADSETALLSFALITSRFSSLARYSLLKPRLVLYSYSTSSDQQSQTVMINVPHESTQVISPETSMYSMLLCGDRFICSRLVDAQDAPTVDPNHVLFVPEKSSIFPAMKTHALDVAGTPRDRLLFSRLSPRHSDVLLAQSVQQFNNESGNYGSTLLDITQSVIQSGSLLSSLCNNSSASIHDIQNNIRRDVELYLNPGRVENISSTEETQRFHVRRQLPYVENPLSFQRYVLFHLSKLVATHSKKSDIEMFTMTQQWKQCLTASETLLFMLQSPHHPTELQMQATTNINKPGSMKIQESSSGKLNNMRPLQSETISLSDRGQAASDTYV